jgi:hypothetical protein
MHLSRCHYHFWKHCSGDVCGIAFKSFVALVMMSSAVLNFLPSRVILNIGNRKSQNGRGQVSGRLWKGRNWIFCVGRCIIMMEEPVSCSPHFRSLSSYHISQMSQTLQIKILINYVTFRSGFIVHSVLRVKTQNKQHCFHLWAHLLCFLGLKWSRTLPVWGLLFDFNVIAINSHLIMVMTSWDFYWWKIIAVFDHPSRVLAQIVWHEPMDISTSSAASQTVISRFPWIMVFTWAIRGLDLEAECQPDHSSSFVEVLPFLKHLNHS